MKIAHSGYGVNHLDESRHAMNAMNAMNAMHALHAIARHEKNARYSLS